MTKRSSASDGDAAAPRILALRKLLSRINGARLCYGEPIRAEGRTIIPVAKMFSAGGGGFGSSEGAPSLDARPSLSAEVVGAAAGAAAVAGGGSLAGGGVAASAAKAGAGTGGGGGGTVWATPIGFIEVTPDGSRFQSIPDPEHSARMLAAAVKALPALMSVWAGVRALRAGAGPDELARVLRAARGRGVRRRQRSPRKLPSPRRSQKR